MMTAWLPSLAMTTPVRCLVGIALLGAAAFRAEAQESPAAAIAEGSTYRFIESYSADQPPSNPTRIGQSRVAYKETMSTIAETARGAPNQQELVLQAIYQERPASVAATDSRRVTAVVRRYETVRIEPALKRLPSERVPFEDLTIWLQPRPAQAPEVLSMRPERSLTGREYVYAARQVFVPDLAFALPDLPIAVGASYRVPQPGMATLLGGVVFSGTLTGTLVEVVENPSGEGLIAVFDIAGSGTIDLGAAVIRAQIRFAFMPEAATPGAADTVTNAPGQVVWLSLNEQITTGDRLRQRNQRQLVLERRTRDPGPLLELPARAPEPTLENSWLVYVDPQNRFHLRHPQEMVPQTPLDEASGQPDPNALELINSHAEGGNVVLMSLLPRDQLRPEMVLKDLQAQWRGLRLVLGEVKAGYLPDAEWPGMRVYRIETVQMPPGSRPETTTDRVNFLGYVIQTGRNMGLYVEASSTGTQPQVFRDLVEIIIKNFQFDQPKASPPASTGAPATPGAASVPPTLEPAPDR